jgi:hypothetical protein
MLSGIKGRISKLERSLRAPTATGRFLASVKLHARLTGISQEAAMQAVIVTLSDEDLAQLGKETKQRLSELQERELRRGARL